MIVVTGMGHALGRPDPRPWLKVPKSRKYMGRQDDLAVVSAGRALADAGLEGRSLGETTGLFLAVGYVPFEEHDIAPVLAASIDPDGRFSMKRFSEGGYQKAHPLLTFRCLPNMPAYHVSVNFDLQGPYLVVYPGLGEFYLALEEAAAALEAGRIERALVGGVAHQRNFLVEHHFKRLDPSARAPELEDAGGWLVLETDGTARARGARVRATLEVLEVAYEPFDPAESIPALREEVDPARTHEGETGPASLAVALSTASEFGDRPGELRHAVGTREGIRAKSTWRLGA
jgi:3-oxoacyl-(acyl-carrier-protein) synthase